MSDDGHIGETHGEFSTVQGLVDGSSEYVRRFVSDAEAVIAAKHYVCCPAAKIGIIVKVIITDGGDHTVFAWERDKGITWPAAAAAFGQYKWG